MHIIFGQDNAQELAGKYTLLELDSFRIENNERIFPAYCVVENVGIMELPNLERMKNLHAELISNYQKRNWDFCLQALEHLPGKWGGELDTFYDDLKSRIEFFIKNPPQQDWSSVILKD
jgi:hypothetical protein